MPRLSCIQFTPFSINPISTISTLTTFLNLNALLFSTKFPDNTDFTVNYCESGDIPEFKLYRPTTGMLNNLSGSVAAWSNHNITILDNLSFTDMPVELALDRSYPNPFNPSTSLSYSIPSDGYVQLSVYDINGRLVEQLVDSYQGAGNYNTMWNASNISIGVYFVRLTAASNVLTQKVMLIK